MLCYACVCVRERNLFSHVRACVLESSSRPAAACCVAWIDACVWYIVLLEVCMHMSLLAVLSFALESLHVRGEIIVVKASDRVLGKNMMLS